MIYINLLPVRQIKKKIQARNKVFAMGSTLLGVLAILGAVALVFSIQVGDLNASIKKLNKEKAKYQKTINQIKKLQKDQELLETKLNTISKLKKGSQLTVRVMDELARVTPSNRVWITRMSFNGTVLKISCIALDNATIADYMETVVTSPYFKSAELSATSTKKVSGRELKSFSLTIRVVNAAYEKEEAEEAVEKQAKN
ncbi:MAG: PilN domain-containing protein [Deltaproteobacteria bacterium]|jgi:type IV pilus assembly protein PilN|nr:PilN domain-containing protein [Deltaproteobacteria bacterium]